MRSRPARLLAAVTVLAGPTVVVGTASAGLAGEAAGPGIPTTVYGVAADGGLPLEKDLAVGPASVALANRTDVFVVTAADGVYHRVRLPGYDAALHDAGAPGIALSPDGTRLAYSWHARRPAPGDTWIPSGARVVDLDSGRLHTGPGRGPSGEGRLAWNFSWSPDGRYLAYATAADDSGFTQRDWFPPSEHGYELLDTTTYRPVDAGPGSQDTEGRPLPVAVSSTGTVFRNGNGQNLVARAGGRDHRRVATFGWRSAHINPSGDWLAAGDDDGISMVLERAVGRPSGSVVTVLPRREVASGSLALLAWPTPTRLVAVRHRQVGPSSFSEDADLVRLTLNIDADDDAWVRDYPRIPRARMEIVGRVTGAEPGTVLSFATGLAAGDPPTREFEPPPFADGHDQPAAGGPTERSAGPTDEAATVPLRTVLLAVTLVALAAAAALLRAARRRVPGT